jgi:hypothetical protein
VHYYNSNEQYHRLDGPAVEYRDGSSEWLINGFWHRLDGPAINFSDYKEWYIKGNCYLRYEHNRLVLFSILEPKRMDLNPTED